MDDNYAATGAALALGDADLVRLAANSFEAAFLSAETRRAYLDRLDAFVERSALVRRHGAARALRHGGTSRSHASRPRSQSRPNGFVNSSTMRMSDVERDKLLLTVAADLAERRRARGLKLNYPGDRRDPLVLRSRGRARATAERRGSDGPAGRSIVGREDVMDGIAEMLDEVQMEATFPDGTKLVTLHQPIR